MRDVRDQVAAYTEQLDRAAPGLEELTAGLGPRRSQPRFTAGWAVAASALGILVVVGGLAALSRRSTTTVPPAESSSTVATTTAAPITLHLLNPKAVTPEMFSGWDHQFAGPGAVIVVDGTYHMLASAYGDGLATVAYAVSPDGIIWSQGANQPVLDLSEAPWAPLAFDAATPRSLVVDAAGNWQLFFDIAWFDKGTDEFRGNIGRAVAPGPAGPWTFDENPVLRPIAGQPWMAKHVSSPSVVVTPSGMLMLFVGNGTEGGVVGLAQSTDGSQWEVRPGPVFAASVGWERDSIKLVDLVAAPGGYAMFYSGDTLSRRGLAVSATGLEWSPHPENPLITTLSVPRASIFDSEFVVDGSTVLAFIENGGMRSEREVVVLRVDVDLGKAIATLTGG